MNGVDVVMIGFVNGLLVREQFRLRSTAGFRHVRASLARWWKLGFGYLVLILYRDQNHALEECIDI